MPIVVVGVNHRTAPIALLERLAIADDDLPKALDHLDNYEHVLEGAVLSTCNRVEVYAVVSKFHAGVQDVKNFLSEFCHVAPEDFVDDAYSYHDEAAVKQLFRVASGIDSMVLGESEILGQVRRAFQTAIDEGVANRVLSTAHRSALRVGKRARSETAIGRNPVSVSSAAVELARRAFEHKDLSGRKVAIVGAGKMGRLAAQALKNAGATGVVVVNRTDERGQDLARTFGAESRRFEELPIVLREADIVICSTTAPQTVIDRSLIETAVADRPHRPLFIVDIAVPRDVDPTVADIPGIFLRDIDDLKTVAQSGMGSRVAEVGKVEAIIDEELQRFLAWERSTEVDPSIASLLAHAEEIRSAELERALGRVPRLTDEERDQIDRMTSRIVAKLLHVPIDKVRRLAASKQGHTYAAALRELFGLDDEPSP